MQLTDEQVAAIQARLSALAEILDCQDQFEAADDLRHLLVAHQAAAPVLAAAAALMHSTVGDGYVQAFDALSEAVRVWEAQGG